MLEKQVLKQTSEKQTPGIAATGSPSYSQSCKGKNGKACLGSGRCFRFRKNGTWSKSVCLTVSRFPKKASRNHAWEQWASNVIYLTIHAAFSITLPTTFNITWMNAKKPTGTNKNSFVKLGLKIEAPSSLRGLRWQIFFRDTIQS